jgi:hypothetical protein
MMWDPEGPCEETIASLKADDVLNSIPKVPDMRWSEELKRRLTSCMFSGFGRPLDERGRPKSSIGF